MKKLLFLLLFPVSVFSQTLQEVDFVAKGYYKVIVSDTLYSQHQNQKECLQQITNLAINNIDAHCEQPWVDVVAEYAESVMDSVVYDTVNVESLTLRQVNWSFQNLSGERKFSYQAEAYGDSVKFQYFHNADLIRSSTQIPANGAVHDTLINPPSDSLQIWIYGYWDKWVEPFTEIVDIALLDTLGEEPDTTDTTMGTFFRSFNDDTLGALPSGFTELFESGGDWEVVEFATAGPDQYLNNATGGTTRDAIGWEQGTDVEIVTKYYRDGGSTIGGPAGRMDLGGAETGYTSWLRGNGADGIFKHETGSETELDATQLDTAHSWVIIRMRINSTDIDVRIHPVDSGVTARSGNDDFVTGSLSSNDHYLFDDFPVQFEADTLPGGISAETTYYVRRIDQNQFAVQDSSPVDGGASDIDITSDGSNVRVINLKDETERTDWNIELTDSDIAGNGYAGLFDIFGNCYFEWIGIGTNGDTAPSSDPGGGGETLELDKGTFNLSGKDLFTNLSTPLDKGAFSLTGYELLQNLSVPLDKGTFSQQGYALSFGLSIPVDKGTFSQTGYDLVFNRSVPLDKGSFTLDGKTINLNLSVPIGKGTFDLTGYDLEFGGQNTLVMGSGSFSVDGKDLSFQFTHVLDKGSFSVDGKNVNFNTSIPLEKSNFNLDGKELSFSQVVPLDKGGFDLTGYQLLFDSVENIVLLSGKSLISDITGSSTISDITGSSTIRDITGDSTL